MSDRINKHSRDRRGHSPYKSEVKSHHKTSTPSASSSHDNSRRPEKKLSPTYDSKSKHESRRKKHRKSRSRSRERRRSSERDRRRREKSSSRSRSPHKKHEDDKSLERRSWESSSRRNQHSRSHSRSASRERERAREKNKQEVKLLMQRNYEEQLEKMKNAATQPLVPLPAANQALKLVEQVQKRKLLFSKKPEEASTTSSLWKQTSLADDSDGKMSAKFRRLMGMKDDDAPSTSASTSTSEVIKTQQQRFAELEKQYEVARMTTHTQRGLGLGFGS
ncbi:Arginine/serine-rich coiled-coil protein 2 [Orchesella cincta]|uniref:Arginine/serine-rich coiled-coil protein 2 n=1 Tax=Orchesella cincta TaxID=48709 RepID=A0A1D2N4W0_ORCCI|nr:Arginine/serine-rich coiled-coil protein 2 [Orchesella cincta]